MDFEQTQVKIPTLSEFNEKIKSLLNSKIRFALLHLIEKISEGENISHDYLISKYGNIIQEITLEPITRKKTRILSSDIRCLAKISGNRRCSRKRKNELYCGGHIERRPHGEFDQ
jgi:hypothetical protein